MHPKREPLRFAALSDSYVAALECYAGWRRRQRERNHYRTRRTDDDDARSWVCAASASLAISKLKIEEAFSSGADVLGDEFISGDAACRDVLLDNLTRLRDCVGALSKAVDAGYHPLPLTDVTCVSEAVRVSSLAALHKQYQRVVVARLAPRGLPLEAPKLPSADNNRDIDGGNLEVVVDRAQTPTNHHRTGSGKISCNTDNNSNNSNHEPPSPPPTPISVSKERPDHDAESTYSWSTTGFEFQPMNSVFSVFCPEAMKYQVDLEKTMPIKGAKCRCGYDWNATCCTENRATMVIKEGFQITPRFLGKSHCEKGLGCVLCTSSGKTETFGSVEGLKTHINSSHTKWQLLHDRDLVGR
ncbi:hypothetical protein E0Z10_g4237 [Xylaria hypoxylon]|uniref:C2H2-type domain-containing protein n=1 Tax=Xylaria hypoxylon TaxID=37992 RepID=A0A4Z0Z4M0_9PEZI|nr:hypothetical protein E0Z10_g4237 [Xylaria hypoxylon]